MAKGTSGYLKPKKKTTRELDQADIPTNKPDDNDARFSTGSGRKLKRRMVYND